MAAAAPFPPRSHEENAVWTWTIQDPLIGN